MRGSSFIAVFAFGDKKGGKRKKEGKGDNNQNLRVRGDTFKKKLF
jgi:hypothetical protein